MDADTTKISLVNQRIPRDFQKYGTLSLYPVLYCVSSILNGELFAKWSSFFFISMHAFVRLKSKLIPAVKAHSETIQDKEEDISKEIATEEEMKKKKHRREKIGFRDRKVQ